MNSSTSKNERGIRSQWKSPRWAVIAICACLVCSQGCGYPEVGPKAYEISKALYSVCNMKRQDDLDKVTEVISRAVSNSELSESESEWLMAIVDQARSGEWAAAAEEARSILQDQVDL